MTLHLASRAALFLFLFSLLSLQMIYGQSDRDARLSQRARDPAISFVCPVEKSIYEDLLHEVRTHLEDKDQEALSKSLYPWIISVQFHDPMERTRQTIAFTADKNGAVSLSSSGHNIKFDDTEAKKHMVELLKLIIEKPKGLHGASLGSESQPGRANRLEDREFKLVLNEYEIQDELKNVQITYQKREGPELEGLSSPFTIDLKDSVLVGTPAYLKQLHRREAYLFNNGRATNNPPVLKLQDVKDAGHNIREALKALKAALPADLKEK